MPYGLNIREGELIKKVANDYFENYDNTKLIGDIDFCVAMYQNKQELIEQKSLLWAEAKKGISDIYKSFVQLILTIGKARTFDKYLPPAMIGALDNEKIAFIPYNDIHDIFYINDFNWNITPSNHKTKEFKIVYDKVKNILDQNTLIYNYEKDDKELKKFIKNNFIVDKFGISRNQIDKNNFIVIYNKWLQSVKPTIAVNWELAKKGGIIAGDFYLADLLSLENETIRKKLFVILKKNKYELDRKINELGMFNFSTASFNDNQKAHNLFWNIYERPPKEEYWDYIIKRRDLLVPQDVRERKGSFFTPKIWVELSQKYLTDVLGEDWQDEYYIWDCAAGTGNLLAGLTNKYNIWASTLDKQDVEVMKSRIKNGANLLEDHVFQFDFLNDEFTKLPKQLQKIINDKKKRKKLVIYINPPYAEVSSIGKKGKVGVNQSQSHIKYATEIGAASREIFSFFFVRIYKEISECILGEFSTIKLLQGSAFKKFRNIFKAKLEKMFVVPAYSFDNVKGRFPIGFKIWNLNKKEVFVTSRSEIYNDLRELKGERFFFSNAKFKFINKWISSFKDKSNLQIGFLAGTNGNDIQQNKIVYILNIKSQMANPRGIWITACNLIHISIYMTIRRSIQINWLKYYDQYFYPNELWKNNKEFQNDCLVFTLFYEKNNITSNKGTNYWIPFTEHEVNSREKFDSNFMTKFINGKLKIKKKSDLLNNKKIIRTTKLKFSVEAVSVFDAGRELWRYYHKQSNCNVNASLYDIRAHFQGRSAKGRMNNRSNDLIYTKLIKDLRNQLKLLAKKIEPKIYKYGFLKK